MVYLEKKTENYRMQEGAGGKEGSVEKRTGGLAPEGKKDIICFIYQTGDISTRRGMRARVRKSWAGGISSYREKKLDSDRPTRGKGGVGRAASSVNRGAKRMGKTQRKNAQQSSSRNTK